MLVGLGDVNPQIAVFIDKRPSFMHLAELDDCLGLVEGEIAAIGQACGNGWRKVFNVYAKLLWALSIAWQRSVNEQDSTKNSDSAVSLNPRSNVTGQDVGVALQKVLEQVSQYSSWQAYRDACLLRSGSGTALLFSPPITRSAKGFAMLPAVQIVMGRGYGKALSDDKQLGIQLHWLNDSFAIDSHQGIIVCPYFDYRQLSDRLIDELVTLILSDVFRNAIRNDNID